MSNNTKLGNFISDKLKQPDPSDMVLDDAQHKSQMQAAGLLMNADFTNTALQSHQMGRLNDAVAKYLGNCALDIFDPHSQHDDSAQNLANARAIADRVQGRASSGDIDDGAEGELSSAYSMASGLSLEAQAAQGHIGAAMDAFRGRRAARDASSGTGLNAEWVAKTFQSEDALRAYMNQSHPMEAEQAQAL